MRLTNTQTHDTTQQQQWHSTLHSERVCELCVVRGRAGHNALAGIVECVAGNHRAPEVKLAKVIKEPIVQLRKALLVLAQPTPVLWSKQSQGEQRLQIQTAKVRSVWVCVWCVCVCVCVCSPLSIYLSLSLSLSLSLLFSSLSLHISRSLHLVNVGHVLKECAVEAMALKSDVLLMCCQLGQKQIANTIHGKTAVKQG